MRKLALFSLPFLVLGCGAPMSGTSGGAGHADTAGVAEVGPLLLGQSTPVALGGAAAAFRVESYGSTALSLALSGPGAPHLRVEGPAPGDGDEDTPGSAPTVAEADGATLDVTLTTPGVYRVIVSDPGAPPSTPLSLQASCSAGCARTEITAQELLTRLRDAGQLDAVVTQLTNKLAELVPDADLRAKLSMQLSAIVNSSDFSGLERFPTLPLHVISQLRPALGLIPSSPPPPDQRVTGDLGELLASCTAARVMPPPFLASLPNVGYGHFPDLSLPRCQLSQSIELAQILTALSLGNGSFVTYRGATLHSPAEVIDALVASGHQVTVGNERTYANFLSLTLNDVEVRWPVWLDTDLKLADGSELTVPMGHSQYVWIIKGPDVNTRVSFFLGIDGSAFFPQTDVRPAWTGRTLIDPVSSTDNPSLLHTLTDFAARYMKRNRTEAATLAAGLPADGYGYLGVCNDSVAALEYASRGTISEFPLIRAASLDQAPALGDGLDSVVRALPHDADATNPDRHDLLRRLMAMNPMPIDSPQVVDETLRAQLEAVQSELGQ